MTCVICKKDDTIEGTATITLQRGEFTFVVKGVPAQVCPNCGEEYVDEAVAKELSDTAEKLAKNGALVEVRQYVRAS